MRWFKAPGSEKPTHRTADGIKIEFCIDPDWIPSSFTDVDVLIAEGYVECKEDGSGLDK